MSGDFDRAAATAIGLWLTTLIVLSAGVLAFGWLEATPAQPAGSPPGPSPEQQNDTDSADGVWVYAGRMSGDVWMVDTPVGPWTWSTDEHTRHINLDNVTWNVTFETSGPVRLTIQDDDHVVDQRTVNGDAEFNVTFPTEGTYRFRFTPPEPTPDPVRFRLEYHGQKTY